MRFVATVCILLFVVTTIPAGITQMEANQPVDTQVLAQTGVVERNWTVQFVLINYDASTLDALDLVSDLPTQRVHDADPITIIYNLQYNVVFASDDYEEQIRQFILTNSINGTNTGTLLDEDALTYHKNHINDPQRIFYPRNGRSIDGVALENWFAENPYLDPPSLGYMFYLLNFSEFDSPDHELEHWFDYAPLDPDTGQTQDWFRLEWDNALNPEVMFEYPGFGGQHNIYVLDPSADQWYLKWARIWWETQTDYEYMSADLDEKIKSLDLSQSSDQDALVQYLAEYIYDPVTKLMVPKSPMAQQNDVTAFVETGYLRCVVICMDVTEGITIDSLRWVTNAEMQKEHLEQVFPFIEWTVDVEYIDIDDSPAWTNLFWDYAEVIDGKTIVDGYSMFDAIRNQVRWQYVDVDDDNINVFGVVFIKKNMEMHVYGKQYTGLGGGGQTVIWKSWERYYRADEETPKAGISSIQLHETLHAIGLGHTWSTDHYVGDFSKNVMGYYGRFNGTGKFEQNWVQSTYLDQFEGRLKLDLDSQRPEDGAFIDDRTRNTLNQINHAFENARAYYNEMDWISCYEELVRADDFLSKLAWTLIDDEPPRILDWGIEGNIRIGNTTVWATITDDLSGILNASVHVAFEIEYGISEIVYPCTRNSVNWSTEIYAVPSDQTVRIWVEAYDKGLNVQKTSEMLFVNGYQPVNPLVIFAIIGVVALVVVVIFIQKRKGA